MTHGDFVLSVFPYDSQKICTCKYPIVASWFTWCLKPQYVEDIVLLNLVSWCSPSTLSRIVSCLVVVWIISPHHLTTLVVIWMSWIHILQDKIHQVTNSICNINKRQTDKLSRTHKNKENPNTSHTPGPLNERKHLSGENHPDPVPPELKGDPPPPAKPSSTCALIDWPRPMIIFCWGRWHTTSWPVWQTKFPTSTLSNLRVHVNHSIVLHNFQYLFSLLGNDSTQLIGVTHQFEAWDNQKVQYTVVINIHPCFVTQYPIVRTSVVPCFPQHFKSQYIILFKLVYYLNVCLLILCNVAWFLFPLFLSWCHFISPLLFLRFFILYIYSALVIGQYQIIEVLPLLSVVIWSLLLLPLVLVVIWTISSSLVITHPLSRIRILQDKIHKVINDIRDINNKAKLNKTKTRKYMANPNTYHNSGRTLRSGENHHPRLDSLDPEEDPGEPSPDPSTSAECSTSTVDTSALSSSPSATGGRYAQSDPPPEMITDCVTNTYFTK